MFFLFPGVRFVGSLALLFLAACTLNTNSSATIEPLPTNTPPPTVENNLPAVGFPDLEPSGVAPCIVKAGVKNVILYTDPGNAASAVALLQSETGLVAFQYQDGWYQVNYNLGGQQLTGWLAEAEIITDGDCNVLHLPVECSVQPSVGRVINIYAQPDVNSQIISALGERYVLPFVEFGNDGWFHVSIGNGQSGWIAPDEGQLVGHCDNGQ